MISLPFCLILTIPLHLSKIGALIVRGEVDNNFGIIARRFFLVLFDTTFDYHIHVFISIPLLINNLSSLVLLKHRIIKYFPTLLCINKELPLFRMIKNLLKHSIFSNLSIFLLPGGKLYYSFIAFMFYKDWIYILFRISLTEGIYMGGFYFNLFSYPIILFLMESNLLLLKSSNIFL